MIILTVFATVIPTTNSNASDSTLAKRNTASPKGRPIITPDKLDLSPYQTIFIGAPI